MVIPESTSVTTSGIIKALETKDDGEALLVAAVRRQVTTGSESVFFVMMIYEVKCDFEKIMGTYLKGKDGRERSPKDFLELARDLANRLAFFLAERYAKRKAAREQKRIGKGTSSSKATGSAT
jgi:hypothetical protein